MFFSVGLFLDTSELLPLFFGSGSREFAVDPKFGPKFVAILAIDAVFICSPHRGPNSKQKESPRSKFVKALSLSLS